MALIQDERSEAESALAAILPEEEQVGSYVTSLCLPGSCILWVCWSHFSSSFIFHLYIGNPLFPTTGRDFS